MAKVTGDGIGEFYQHYPRTDCVVTAQAKGKENAMTVAWHSSISFRPPLYGVSVSARRFTYQLIADSKEFGVNFLPFTAAEVVAAIGGSSGREIEKFQQFNIAQEKPVETAVPILKDAYAAYECRLVDDRGYGDHQWLVGEIVAAHFFKESFTSDGTLDLDRVRPILYLGHELYVTTSADTIKSLDRKAYGKR
jgi:flavin reductase (DIM6/NTAB) family NADH-FMN oxidoreductase RutF